jgi:hypothetical protein
MSNMAIVSIMPVLFFYATCGGWIERFAVISRMAQGTCCPLESFLKSY